MLAAQGGFNGRAFAIEPVHIRIEPIIVELGKVLFQNVLQLASFFGFLGFLPLPPIGVLLFCFGNPPFNEIEHSTH